MESGSPIGQSFYKSVQRSPIRGRIEVSIGKFTPEPSVRSMLVDQIKKTIEQQGGSSVTPYILKSRSSATNFMYKFNLGNRNDFQRINADVRKSLQSWEPDISSFVTE